MNNSGLSIAAGILQGVGNYYDARNQSRRQKQQDAEDKEDREYTLKDRKKKDLTDLAANFDDVNWQLSTTPEQQQAALQQYNAGASEVGLPQRQIRDRVSEAMLEDSMKLKQAGATPDQAKVYLAKSYGNDRLQQFLGGQGVSAQVPAPAQNNQVPANTLASATPMVPSQNAVSTTPPAVAVAGSTEEIGQQSSAPDALSTLYAPSANSKEITSYANMLRNDIESGTRTNKDAVDAFAHNYPGVSVPSDFYTLKPKPSVTNQAGKSAADAKQAAQEYYQRARQAAMDGKFTKSEWYRDPILKLTEFPALSPSATLDQKRTEKLLEKPVVGSGSGSNGGSSSRGGSGGGSGVVKPLTDLQVRNRMSSISKEKQSLLTLANKIKYVTTEDHDTGEKSTGMRTLTVGQKNQLASIANRLDALAQEATGLQQKYAGSAKTAQTSGSRVSRFSLQTERQLVEVAKQYSGNAQGFAAAIRRRHPGFNANELVKIYNHAKGAAL